MLLWEKVLLKFIGSSVYRPQFIIVLFLLFIVAIAVTGAAFGRGTGPLVLNSVGCTGTESSLLSCSHRVVGVTTCSHYNDAGVVCPTCKLLGHA